MTFETFLDDSMYFAYSKRGLYKRDRQFWSRWKEENYTNEQMINLAETYTKRGLSWFRSTVGFNHTLFVLDFDIEIPLADQIVTSRLDQLDNIKDRKKKYEEKKNIENFRFDVHELAMNDFLKYAFKNFPKLEEFSWKFSGGVGRRHAIQKTTDFKDPNGFRPIFDNIAKKLEMDYFDEREFHYTGSIDYQNATYRYIIKLDLAMTDPDRLIRGVYSPHFKDRIVRYSIPIPIDRIFSIDYIRDNCYKVDLEELNPFELKPFSFQDQYDSSFKSKPKQIKVKKFEVREGSKKKSVSIDMGKIPDFLPDSVVKVLDTITYQVPCMNVHAKKSHPARTRFGNVATQKFSPEQVTAYFRDHVNDEEHNANLHISYYHLQRLKPFGVKGFGYWDCSTFQKKKNNFSVPIETCIECPIYTKFQEPKEHFDPQPKQSPHWIFSDIDEEYNDVNRQQQDRDKLRKKLEVDIHKMIRSNIQFNEIQAPVRTGKTKGIINVIAEKSRTEKKPRSTFFVGNIAGTKENIHAEAIDSGFEGRALEWGSKSDLCPIKQNNPDFIVTSGFCKSCPRYQTTKEIIKVEELTWLLDERWELPKSPSKTDWMGNNRIKDDDCCNYYAMKSAISKLLEAKNENLLVIADPRFIMQRDLIVTANNNTYDWIQLFDLIIYDESHNVMSVAYETMVQNIDLLTQEEIIDDLFMMIEMDKEFDKRDDKGFKALKELQSLMRQYATRLRIYDSIEITEVNDAEDGEILNHSTEALQKYISTISTKYTLEEEQKEAIHKLLEIIGIHDWIIINHAGEDNWFDLFIFGEANGIFHEQKDVMASGHTIYLKSKAIEPQDDWFAVDEISFPILPIHHAKKVIFMSATPSEISKEILMLPTRKYQYFPKNQAKVIFNQGVKLTKTKVNKLKNTIIELTNHIDMNTKGKVLLVTDNKKRLDVVFKKKNADIMTYHPRDSQNAEGTTLRGFDVSIAINNSFQNIVSVENMSRIISEIWEYDKNVTTAMLQELSSARVVQAMARIMPYNDDDDPVIMILLDERFIQSARQIIEWLSPATQPIISQADYKGVYFSNVVKDVFDDKKVYKKIINDMARKRTNKPSKKNTVL